jgi:hypothetical protein
MNNQHQQPNDTAIKPDYEPPMVRMMSETEVLSAFQVTAAGTTTWWAM